MTDDVPDLSEVPSYVDMLSLKERAFVVSGAGQGIGRQTAHALASAGARVLCVDIVPERATRVAAETNGVALEADMCERADVQRALDVCVESFGRLDGIVDIIGQSRFSSIVDTTDEDWEWSQRMNLRHTILLTQLGGQALAERGGGSIVFIASINGLDSSPNQAAYGVAKAGIVSLTQTASVEFGPRGVRVNAVAPGVVWTPRMAAVIGEDQRSYWGQFAPLQRVAVPADIAAAVLFLSSDLASYITGQTLVVDGGNGRNYPFPIDRL